MTFAYPYLLYFLIVPVVLLGLAYWMGRRRSHKWELLIAPELRKELVTPPSYARRMTALIMGLLGLALIIAALARPQWGEREVPEVTRGRNLLIALDISRSMLTRDVQPSRIEQARTAAFDLLDALPEDKIGLIVFSGDATLVVPLTHDHNAIRETLEQANYGWAGYGGTNFNQVIQLSLKTFERAEGTNALVLLSDGENTEPISPQVAQDALKSKLIVIAAGVGTATGDTIPDASSRDGLYHDRSGNLVISKFDSTSLQTLAKDTNGQYAAISSGASLNGMVREVAKRLDERESGTATRKVAEERYAPFLALGLILLVLALMLSAQWSKNGRHQGRVMNLLFFFLLISPGTLLGQEEAPPLPDKPGNLREPELKQEDTAQNTENKEISLEEQAKQSFEKGYKDFKEGKFDQAASAYSQALLSEKGKVQAETHYNLANALVEKNLKLLKSPEGQKLLSDEKSIDAMEAALKEAIVHYDDTLKSDSSHANAKTNKVITEQIIKKLEEQKKQNQQQQQQDKDQKDQDQKDQNQQNKDQKDQDQKDQNQQNKDQKDQDQKDQNQQNKDQKDQDQKDQNQQNKDQKDQDQKDQNQQNKDQKDQDQKDQNQQNKDQKDQDQKDQNQQDKDQKDQDQKDQNQQNKDQKDQDQKDQNQQDKDQKDQDQKDQNQQNKDQKDQDQKDQNQQNQGQQPQPKEGDKKEPVEPREPGEEQQQGEPKEIPVGEEQGMTKEQAARILKERADLEKGNPYPNRRQNNTPVKDW